MTQGQIYSPYFTGLLIVSNGSPVSGSTAGSAAVCTSGFVLKAGANNSGSFFICNLGSGSPNGFYLKAGEQIPIAVVNLNQVLFDYSATNGSICWLKMG